MDALESDRRGRINRLKWHCRRALLELDIVFKRFWERHGDDISQEQEDALRQLLAMEDHDLWAVVNGKDALLEDEAHLQPLVEELRRSR